MFESGKKASIDKKSYEITYALFRISQKISEPGIAQKIGDMAVGILESAVAGELIDTIRHLEVVDYLFKLAMDLGSINFLNADLLLREIDGLKTAIAEQVREKNTPVDIAEFFIPAESDLASSVVIPSKEGTQDSVSFSKDSDLKTKTTAIGIRERVSESGNPANTFLKSGMRQIAILDKIRQSGNCRLRDILEVLPDTSERTIRYDLEDLIERNLIERVGTGGPSVYYKIQQPI